MTQNQTEQIPASREQIRKSTAPKKRRRRRRPAVVFRLSMLVFIWLICFISCFAAYMIGQNLFPETESSTRSTTEQTADANSSDTADEPTATKTKTNPVPKGSVMQKNYLTQCAFLGDSVIYAMGQSGYLDEKNVYSAETLCLETYKDTYVSIGSSQVHFLSAVNGADCPIYLMFGTDSLAENTPEEAADRFSTLLNAIKNAAPDADVFVLSVPPVTEAAETADPALRNSSIDAYNSMLLSIANSANVYFVDTNTALKNSASKLDAANAAEDGIRLTENGANQLLDYILCHVPA